jgi:RND family efflux transporter MFP subunit
MNCRWNLRQECHQNPQAGCLRHASQLPNPSGGRFPSLSSILSPLVPRGERKKPCRVLKVPHRAGAFRLRRGLAATTALLLAAVCAVCFCPVARAAEAKFVSGITEPFLDVTLGASVAGIIHAEFFKEGDRVKKGDVILELDKQLEELEVGRRQAVMTQNQMEFDSTRALVQTTKSVSKEELAKKEAEYNIAAAEHGIAVEQLAHRRIVAPFAGAITEIQLHPGAACAPYQPLVRLVDTTRCYFVGQIEGKAASTLRPDQLVNIEVDGCPAPVTGRICFISPVVDPASGLARVKALFENADGKIRPGLAAKMAAE